MQVKIAILGYGKRGAIYAHYAKNFPEEFKVVAVAEIDPVKREIAKATHNCPVFEDWKEMLSSNLQADIIAVATQDADHPEHAVACMEKGYDTLLSEEGGNLSEGQKQLLCITRIMLMQPPMLILDEATSSIDTRTERKISDAFQKLMEGRTSFVVAHRLSTIVHSDCILVMESGRVVEKGTHKQLLEKGGAYARLYNGQFA